MGLFTRKKSIYEYKMMEQVKCDLDAAMRNPNPGYSEYCRLIAESNDYLFYSYMSYQDNSGGYVIRKSKTNPRETLFFGENYQLACIFKNFLFQCGHSGERGRFYIFAKNILTGNVLKCDWLGKGDVFVNINGYGRFYVQDTINNVSVQGDTLVFDVTRKKSSRSENPDKYDVDTNYSLKVTIENGHFKPVAYFNIASMEGKNTAKDTEKQCTTNDAPCSEKPSVPSGLGRDEDKHISCKYEGNRDDCPKDCEKCAISIKTDGDIALAQNDFDKAIKQYKKAVFVEPKFAEAWVNMGNAYGMKSEYNNAVSAFNKAIAIDPTYGKALFGKAITLKKQGKLDEAMALANRILEMYDDPNVRNFKDTLVHSGVKDLSNFYSLEQAIDIMTDQAYDIIQANNMLDENGRLSTEKEIYFKEDFARSIYGYCKKQYGVLGLNKVWSESILAAFYGSLCTTLLYYKDKAGFKEVAPFTYLSNHVNLEELDRNAERLLEIRQDESKSDDLWNLIYSYLTACKTIFEKVEPEEDVEAAVIDATESAYVMGMLYAMRYNTQELSKPPETTISQKILDQLDRLHEEIE